jgi:hypothetical protein
MSKILKDLINLIKVKLCFSVDDHSLFHNKNKIDIKIYKNGKLYEHISNTDI